MVFFISMLKALAVCLITNAHYTGIYPTDLIANGGLIGDVLFFSISGFCLYNIKDTFPKWYGKRLWRVYPPVIIATVVYLIVGAYTFRDHSALWWFAYPTYYHFVASIVLLYIPYYLVMKIQVLKYRIPQVMAILAACWLFVYFVFYDRSYYHIDTVREPMIRFLFMESMLLGAWFRQNDAKIRNQFRPVFPLVAMFCFFVYFASKLFFTKAPAYAPLQFLNQIAIFALLYFLFRTFSSLDKNLESLPRWIKSCVNFVSSISLEVYVVQYVLIDLLRPIGHFPLNWLVLTSAIFSAASLLHFFCKGLYQTVAKHSLCAKR